MNACYEGYGSLGFPKVRYCTCCGDKHICDPDKTIPGTNHYEIRKETARILQCDPRSIGG